MTTNGWANGWASKIIFYLLGILQVGVIFFLTYWVGRIDGAEAKIVDHERWSNTKVIEYENRISTLEAQYNAIKGQLDRIEAILVEEHDK